MGIGLSNGAYYDDEHHYAAAKWDDKYDNNELDPEVNDLHTEDNNVQAPPSRVEKNTDPQQVNWLTDMFSSKQPEVNLAPNLSKYPTQDDAKLAIKSGMGYGTGNEPYINAERANVYKNPVTHTDLDKVIAEPLENTDLTKLGNIDSLSKVNTAFAQAALAVNKDPIAALGFDGSKVNLQIKSPATNLAGFTDPKTGQIWVNLQQENKSTIAHESIHKGLIELRNSSQENKDLVRELTDNIAYKLYSKYEGDTSEKAQNLLKSLPEEFMVRYIMQDKLGDPEEDRIKKHDPDRKQLAAQQRDEAIELFKDKDLKKQLDKIREAAINLHKERTQRGPH